jgi:hypothetical protein
MGVRSISKTCFLVLKGLLSAKNKPPHRITVFAFGRKPQPPPSHPIFASVHGNIEQARTHVFARLRRAGQRGKSPVR